MSRQKVNRAFKKTLKIISGGLLAIILIPVIVFSTVHPDELINAHKEDLSAAVSEAIGRKVVLGPVKSSFFPYLGAELQDVQIAAAQAGAPPQATLKSMVFKLRWLDALFSFGRNLRVKAFSADGLVVRIERDENGRWDFQDIIDHLSSGPVSPDDDDVNMFTEANLQRAAIEHARIEIRDAGREKPLVIDDLLLEGQNLALGAPLDIRFSTVFDDGDQKAPVSVKLYASELRKDSPLEPLPDVKFSASIRELGLASWARLLPPDSLRATSGIVTIETEAEVKEAGASVMFKGAATTKDLVLAKKKQRGTPLSGDLEFALTANTVKDIYDIEVIKVNGAGVHIDGQLHANGRSLANLYDTELKVTVDNLPKTLAILPADAGVLPPDLSLKGPLTARLSANGKKLVLNVDGGRTDIRYGTQFQKKAGAPFSIDLDGTYEETYLRIAKATARVGPIGIAGSMSLPIKSGTPYLIDLHTGTIEVASLKEVLPDISTALSNGRRVDGTFKLDVNATDRGGKQLADIGAELRSVAIQTPTLRAAGDADLMFAVHPQKGITTIQGEGRFDGFALRTVDDDGAVTLNKRSGERLRLEVDIERNGAVATIKKALLSAGKTSLSATGTAKDLEGDNGTLDLRFGNVDVAFDDLRRMLPGASVLPAGGTLTGQLTLAGPATDANRWKIMGKAMRIAFGKTKLNGDVTLQSLVPAVGEVALTKSTVVYSDILALEPSWDYVPKTSRYEGDVRVAFDADNPSGFDLDLNATRLRLDPDTELKGKIAFKNIERPKIEAHLTGKSFNVDQAFPSDDEAEATPDENENGLSTSARAFLNRSDIRGDARVGRVVVAEETFRDVDAAFTLVRGDLAFQRLRLSALDGNIDGTGTSAGLGKKTLTYHVKATTKDVSIKKLLTLFTERGEAFDGKMSNDIDIVGAGLTSEKAASSLDGQVTLKTEALQWRALDVLNNIKKPLQTALKAKHIFDQFAGFGLNAASAAQGASSSSATAASSSRGRRGRGRSSAKAKSSKAKRRVTQAVASPTTLRDIDAFIKFIGGKFTLDKKLVSKTSYGALSLGGGGGLDGTVDMTARAALSKKMLNDTFGINAKQDASVPLRIQGSWLNPQISGIDIGGLVDALAKESGAAKVINNVRGAVTDGVDTVKETVKGAVTDTVDNAKEKAAAAAAEAQQRADDAKRDAERRAKEAADAAKKRAQDEAERARERAKKEAKKRADEAKKKAAEKAKNLLGL